jgi:transposase
MRFVPLKDEHQQATLCLHRTRQGFVEERTAIYNRIRGLLSEFGVVLPQSPERLRREITVHLDSLPSWANRCISDLLEHAGNIEARLAEYDRAISQIARDDERSRRLMQLRGIGPTTASALLASLGAGHDFQNGRQVGAWLGLTPGQHSSGGKQRLGSITKAGDAYLRCLLVNGARAVIANLGEKQDRFSRWARSLVGRRGYWRAAVAIRRAKESCHQKRSNVVNTRCCVAIAAATKSHIALPKGRHCTLVLCRTPSRTTRHGHHYRGESYRTCGCRNAVR